MESVNPSAFVPLVNEYISMGYNMDKSFKRAKEDYDDSNTTRYNGYTVRNIHGTHILICKYLREGMNFVDATKRGWDEWKVFDQMLKEYLKTNGKFPTTLS